ncbi:MAG TPA: SdpI family protein [Pyrinomonadaceae bacterium]
MLITSITGVVLVALGATGALGKVPPNKWFGMSTAKTLSDDKIWYDVHRIAGRGMLIAGGLLCVAALALFLLWEEMSEMTRLMIAAGVVLASLAILVSRIFAALDRL